MLPSWVSLLSKDISDDWGGVEGGGEWKKDDVSSDGDHAQAAGIYSVSRLLNNILQKDVENLWRHKAHCQR